MFLRVQCIPMSILSATQAEHYTKQTLVKRWLILMFYSKPGTVTHVNYDTVMPTFKQLHANDEPHSSHSLVEGSLQPSLATPYINGSNPEGIRPCPLLIHRYVMTCQHLS